MSTILFVDDDVLFLRALTTQLDFPQLGYDRALTANGVDQAVQILDREPVDVMVCDIEMPEKSGMELAHYVAEQGLKIVLLLLTCHSSFDYAKEAIGLDVFDYLLKPIRMEVLQERLVEALQRKKEMDWLAEYRQELSDLPPVGENDTVRRVREFIESNIHTELTREQLGHALFMNPDYIARVFREQQGISLTDYIRTRRISRAKRLLRETNLPLSEICAMVGHTYNSYFFNNFKKLTGMSPIEYRNQCKK